MKNTDDPLVQIIINWSKIKRHIVSAIVLGIELGKRFVVFSLKTILKLLTLLVKAITNIYLAVSKFAKSKQRGVWIVVLIILLLIVSLIAYKRIKANQIELQRLEEYNQQILKEKEGKEKELKETKEKLETKLNRPLSIGAARITQARPLNNEIKAMVAKHADAYGVNRAYCECIVTIESGGNSEAVGDRGAAIGVAQYHLKTYLADAQRVGLPVQDDRKDADKSILAMSAALSRGEDSKWTDYWKCI